MIELHIRPFEPADQQAASALVLAGLVEHWGFLDTSLNPDLKDIQRSYEAGCFLVAEAGGKLVGTGAFLPLPEEAPEAIGKSKRVFQIMRMTVDRHFRRCGIGRRILERLLTEAKGRGADLVILETTTSWREAVVFYLANGSTITGEHDGDTYFALDLSSRAG